METLGTGARLPILEIRFARDVLHLFPLFAFFFQQPLQEILRILRLIIPTVLDPDRETIPDFLGDGLPIGAGVRIGADRAFEGIPAVGSATSALPVFRGRRQPRHPVGDRDPLFGPEARRQAGQEFIMVIVIIGRKLKLKMIRPNQPVVHQRKFPLIHIAGLHFRQRYGRRFRHHHGRRDIGFIRRLQHEVIPIFQRNLVDLPFHRHQIVLQKHLLRGGQPGLDPKTARRFLVIVRRYPVFVPARRHILKQNFPDRISGLRAFNARHRFILDLDPGTFQSLDKLPLRIQRAGIDIRDLKHHLSSARLGHRGIQTEIDRRRFGAGDPQIRGMPAFQDGRRRLELDAHLALRAHRNHIQRGRRIQADPGRRRGAALIRQQRQGNRVQICRALVFERHGFGDLVIVGHAGFHIVWRHNEIGLRRRRLGEMGVNNHCFPTGGAVLSTDDAQGHLPGCRGAVVGPDGQWQRRGRSGRQRTHPGPGGEYRRA